LHGFEKGDLGGEAGEWGAMAGGLIVPELEMGLVGAGVALAEVGGDAAVAALEGLAVFKLDVALPIGAGFLLAKGDKEDGATLGGGEGGESLSRSEMRRRREPWRKGTWERAVGRSVVTPSLLGQA